MDMAVIVKDLILSKSDPIMLGAVERNPEFIRLVKDNVIQIFQRYQSRLGKPGMRYLDNASGSAFYYPNMGKGVSIEVYKQCVDLLEVLVQYEFVQEDDFFDIRSIDWLSGSGSWLDLTDWEEVEERRLKGQPTRAQFVPTDRRVQPEFLYDHFTFIDATVLVSIGNVVAEVKNLESISYSIHRGKQQVRKFGQTYATDIARGSRTVSGSMVFLEGHESPLRPIYPSYLIPKDMEFINATNIKLQPTLLPDQLPPMDMIIVWQNEYGWAKAMFLYGIEIVDEGSSRTTRDMVEEVVFQYIATDMDLPKRVYMGQDGTFDPYSLTSSDLSAYWDRRWQAYHNANVHEDPYTQTDQYYQMITQGNADIRGGGCAGAKTGSIIPSKINKGEAVVNKRHNPVPKSKDTSDKAKTSRRDKNVNTGDNNNSTNRVTRNKTDKYAKSSSSPASVCGLVDRFYKVGEEIAKKIFNATDGSVSNTDRKVWLNYFKECANESTAWKDITRYSNYKTYNRNNSLVKAVEKITYEQAKGLAEDVIDNDTTLYVKDNVDEKKVLKHLLGIIKYRYTPPWKYNKDRVRSNGMPGIDMVSMNTNFNGGYKFLEMLRFAVAARRDLCVWYKTKNKSKTNVVNISNKGNRTGYRPNTDYNAGRNLNTKSKKDSGNEVDKNKANRLEYEKAAIRRNTILKTIEYFFEKWKEKETKYKSLIDELHTKFKQYIKPNNNNLYNELQAVILSNTKSISRDEYNTSQIGSRNNEILNSCYTTLLNVFQDELSKTTSVIRSDMQANPLGVKFGKIEQVLEKDIPNYISFVFNNIYLKMLSIISRKRTAFNASLNSIYEVIIKMYGIYKRYDNEWRRYVVHGISGA